MPINTVSIKTIKENGENPRNISDENYKKLKRSIQDFPEMLEARPLVIDENNTVIGGNMRLRVLKDLGYTKVPTEQVSWTEEQKQEFIIKDNVAFGEWDWEALGENWNVDNLKEWGLDIPESWEEKEVQAEEDDYEIPDDIQTDIVVGDLIEIGQHRLLCGDATDSDAVAKLMDGEKVDMVFTDPPYGLGGYGGRNNMDLKNDDGNDNLISSYYALPIYYEAREVYIWGNAINLFKHLKDQPKDVIVWRKNNFGLGKGYRGQYELCFYFGDFNGSDSDVWDISKDTNYTHPTQKPIALCGRAIKNSDPINVVDLFMGSGSTMAASEQLNRKCYGMELDPKYCQVVIDRMLTYDPDLKIFKNGEEKRV